MNNKTKAEDKKINTAEKPAELNDKELEKVNGGMVNEITPPSGNKKPTVESNKYGI